jgi:hypothetical protein
MAFMNPPSIFLGPIHVIHGTWDDGWEGSCQRGTLQLPRGIKNNQKDCFWLRILFGRSWNLQTPMEFRR